MYLRVLASRPACVLALAGLFLFMHGCASTGYVDPANREVSLVYGYIDMEEAPSNLEWVNLKDYSDQEQGVYTAGVDEGLFLHVGVEPGSYQVSTFGGTGGIPFLTSQPYQYDFGGRGRNATARRIEQSGVYFLGAYKAIMHPGGWFEADKFEMQPTDEPSEAELLERVISHMTESDDLNVYTYQIGMAKRRLEELR